MHSPDHPRRSFVTLGLAGDAGVRRRKLNSDGENFLLKHP